MIITGIVTDTSSFELDYDGWATGSMDRFFLRGFGSTISINTGPSSAADGSYYVYASGGYSNDGQNFDLQKTFPPGQELYGVAFQYHMYGATMGSAILETSADGTSWVSLWSKSGNMGNQWLQATVYAGSGQTMLRYTCVPSDRKERRRAMNDVHHCSMPSFPPHQVYVRIINND